MIDTTRLFVYRVRPQLPSAAGKLFNPSLSERGRHFGHVFLEFPASAFHRQLLNAHTHTRTAKLIIKCFYPTATVVVVVDA